MSGPAIERGFARLAEGQVHYRRLDAADGASNGLPPLLAFHLSPSSSRALEPLMLALRAAGYRGQVLAPDTLGNGDSAPPAREDADIAYFADSMVRFMDTLGLERAALYGTHTGARIACEVAAAFPDRVSCAVLSGITEYDAATRAAYTQDYVPQVEPDEYGRQLVWAFNFMRDQYLFAPYYKREAANRIARDLPSNADLHLATLDILKALDTYHIPYLAAFDYPTKARIAQIEAPTVLMRPASAPPFLNAAARELVELLRDGRCADVDATMSDYAAALAAFLGEHNVADRKVNA